MLNGNNFAVANHSDYNNSFQLSMRKPDGIVNSEFPLEINTSSPFILNEDLCFWFRLYNPNGAVGKGTKGDPGPQGP